MHLPSEPAADANRDPAFPKASRLDYKAAIIGAAFPKAAPEEACRPPPWADAINHPAYYKAGDMEAIEVIESFQLGFHLGNVVKYLLRAGRKGDALEDLEKARWYLDSYIKRLEEC